MNDISDIKTIWNEFMKAKGFFEIPNVPLVPENDPSLLFVNSGMFPLGPYLRGEVAPPSRRLFNNQRCVRFDDIEEVGDDRHTSFFHMIGDWSIGDFFKETQIPLITEFLVEKLGLDPKKLYVSVFAGNEFAPRDNESIKLWQEVFTKYGVETTVSDVVFDEKTCEPNKEVNITKDSVERIFAYPMKKNWWKRGDAPGELGGPDTEMFYDTGRTHDEKWGKYCHINCDCGRFIEIGNNVFMQYVKNNSDGWDPLPQKNVDFGGGLERMAMAAMGLSDIFLTPEFLPIIKKIEEISNKKYENYKKEFQIIADHMRAATFIIADGVYPSNKDQGYIVRRLIRRSIRFAKTLGIEKNFAREVTEVIIDMFKNYYPFLLEKQDSIISEIEKEEKKFMNTLQKGLKELDKILSSSTPQISPEQIFNLYQTYGFPVEMTVEEISDRKINNFNGDEILSQVRQFIKAHQEKSRTGSEQKFKGGLADTSEKTTAFHTTAHLFLEAARRVLGDHVHQRGSNITPDRIRFDFSHPNKLTSQEIAEIEKIVNEQIDKELDSEVKEYDTDEAFRIGAEGEFRDRYKDKVTVYKFYKDNDVFSFEICGGPHVKNTREIKKYGKFKIIKEESSSAGVRRIKAELI